MMMQPNQPQFGTPQYGGPQNYPNQQQYPPQYPPQFPQNGGQLYPPPPQPPFVQYDPNAQMNAAVVGGFGDMFFNMNDPQVAKTNVPIKQNNSMHTAFIIGTVLLIAGVAVGAAGLNRFLSEAYITGIIIGVGYLIYLISCTCCSDIRGYITNLKKFDDYKSTYDSMVVAKGYFRFWIECYHYRTVRTKNGTRRQKVVTHTASEDYHPRESVDVSGNVTGIQDITKYVFINYLKKFYFADGTSEANFNKAYQSFVSRNRRDEYQNHSHTFDIPGFQEQVGFCALGEGSHNSFVFYLSAFIGCGLPYACILQRSVSRYSINIVKKLTC